MTKILIVVPPPPKCHGNLIPGLACWLGFLSVALNAVMIGPACGADAVTHVVYPPADVRSDLLPCNRRPLLPSKLIELPLGAVRPAGWLRKQLELQAAGFHGHLGEISPFLAKKDNAWLDPEGRGSHGWEEVPYWLKGYLATAYLLDDPKMIRESRVWIEGALNSVQPDGWFGPRKTRSTVRSTSGPHDLWPNMVMLFCLQGYYDTTNDARVIDLMKNYFRWQLTVPDDQFLPPYWQQQRAADNLYSVYWLYNRTGDARLLELAAKIHRHTADWTTDVANWHNVNMSQAFGGPTTYFQQSASRRHLVASYRNYSKIRDMYGQVPGGMFGGDENCRPGFVGPRQAIETCGMVEMMLSTELLANITGDTLWADRCEDVAFNSLPAALTADFRALRYLTAPNMVLSDSANKSPGVQNGGPMFLMNPNRHRCCQHNFGHGWPYYVTHTWSATSDRGLAAVLYGPSVVTATVADGQEVTLTEATHYPFDSSIELSVETARPVEFPIYLRVPDWCSQPRLSVNGQPQSTPGGSRGFLCVNRRWRRGDTVILELPMQTSLRHWAGNFDSLSVDRGPLTYSLEIGESTVRAGGTDTWPAMEIHPMTDWNYGLVLNDSDPNSGFRVVRRSWPDSDMPFTLENVPIHLVATARKIPEWQLDHLGLVGKLQPSPVRSDEANEQVRLVPMGAARLRISAFPVIGDREDAHRWKVAPRPRPYRATSSHCFQSDTVRALLDRRLPSNSGDHSIPRMTWWDHRGTKEWVQYEFQKPREVSSVRVYWFDDTGRGNCRVPSSWKVLFEDSSKSWQPVKARGGSRVEADQFNEQSFEPVTTRRLRLEVQLQNKWSAGILEWEVMPEESGPLEHDDG